MLNWNVPANTNDDVAIASRPPWLQTLRHRRCWWRWWWFKRGFSGHAWKVRCRDNVPKWWLLCYSLLVTCKLPSTHSLGCVHGWWWLLLRLLRSDDWLKYFEIVQAGSQLNQCPKTSLPIRIMAVFIWSCLRLKCTRPPFPGLGVECATYQAKNLGCEPINWRYSSGSQGVKSLLHSTS